VRAPKAKWISVCMDIGMVAIFVAALVLLLLPLFGLRLYLITGASMAGAIDKGALILDRTVPVSSLEVGDVITFRPPGRSEQVTHRIVSMERLTDGTPAFRTKGDANPVSDPWQVTFDHPKQAVYVSQVPYVGYAIAAINLPVTRRVLFGGAVLVLGSWALFQLCGKAGKRQRRRRMTSATAATVNGQASSDPWRTRRIDRRR
jgi:signal peptidase I